MNKTLGFKNYNKVFRKLQQIGSPSVMPALEQIGLKVQGDAKELAPVDTGWLRMNTMLEKFYSSQSVIVYNAVKYAPYIEFGTSRMKPRSFMLPAFKKNKKWADRYMEKQVNSYIKKIATK